MVLVAYIFYCVTMSSPGSSTIRPAEREGAIVSWDIEVFALFSPAEVIMFLFSRSFFSYQGKLRVVLGQL